MSAPRHMPQQVVTVKKAKKWPWVVGMFVAFLLGLFLGLAAGTGSSSSPARSFDSPAGTVSTPGGDEPVDTTSALPAGSFGDGKYEVGVEIEPGTYKTDGPPEDSIAGMCYWAKYKNADGDFKALTSNDTVQGRSTVNIKPGGYMEFTGGCIWQKQ